MNDDELRAFLESASGDGPEKIEPAKPQADGDKNADSASGRAANDGISDAAGAAADASDTADAADASDTADAADASDTADAADSKRSAPTFDELMGFPPPASTASGAGATQSDGDEQLVPLILPGFSPDSRPKRPLPPVFQADAGTDAGIDAGIESDTGAGENARIAAGASRSAAGASASAAGASGSASGAPLAEPQSAVDETTPTQPFDVIPEASQPVAAVAPVLAVKPEPAADTNPFAALSLEPDSDSDSDPDFVEDDDRDYEKIAVTGSAPRGRKALPWIIVGGGAVIAIIASILVINGVRGSGDPEPTPSPTVTTEPTTPSPTPEPSPEEPTPEPEPESPPEVDPGDTYPLAITQWGLTVDRSNSFGGSTPYELQDGNARAMFELPLAQSLPESCAAARTGWGLLRVDAGTTLEVIRPEPRCTDEAAAAVYDKIWGLMAHMANTARAS